MRIERIVFDRCGKEIPKVTETNIFGTSEERYRLGLLNFGFPFYKVDLSRFGVAICERCALDMSAAMYEWKFKVEREACV